MLVNPVNEAAVAPKSISVEPIVTLSFANLAFVTLLFAIFAVVMFPSCTVPATFANEAVAAALKVVALAATEAEVVVTVGAKPLALVATEAV